MQFNTVGFPLLLIKNKAEANKTLVYQAAKSISIANCNKVKLNWKRDENKSHFKVVKLVWESFLRAQQIELENN